MGAANLTKQLLERYQLKLAERGPIGLNTAASPTLHELQRRSYQQAAAVLHCFSADALQPVLSRLRHEAPRRLLFDDIVPATGAFSDRHYSLRPELRRRALHELGSREAMRNALTANPSRPTTALQQMWESYLDSGTVPKPEALGYGDLTMLCQILAWLDGLDESLPSERDVLDLVRQRSVFGSFEHLVAQNFTGRIEELARLRDHIGALAPATGLQAVQRQLGAWLRAPLGLSRQPILAIHGPGGIGKSALIGRMLWEHSQADPQARMPFAYLAFDQPALRVENPFTLLIEAAAQFELQFPRSADAIASFRNGVRQFRDARAALGQRRVGTSSRGARIGEVRARDVGLYEQFASLMERIAQRTVDGTTVRSPVLLVFDTFEEVQYRDRESLSGLWRMLDVLQRGYPPLRVVISGRGPLAESPGQSVPFDVLALTELSLGDRVTLLQRLGVREPAEAKLVAEQVGGNPLSLRLAASVIASNPHTIDAKGIAGLMTRRWLFFQIDEEIIQGQLYRRILDHIHDDNVRKLAHPGMILRRVDPDVIFSVLAPWCLKGVVDWPEAERLFAELKREHALVVYDPQGALVYRPEIRRAMVRLLEQDRYAEVRELRRRAIDYYALRNDLVSRAEEIHHRLALGDVEPWTIDERWMTGIEPSILSSIDEYPDRSKALLASRMKLEVPRSVLAGADIAEWERNITRKVQRALSELEVDWALQLLAEREERSGSSPLYALEAKAHLLREDLDSAALVLEAGIQRISRSTNRGRLAELFWLQSQVAVLLQDPPLADACLESAEQAIKGATSPIPLIHVLCHRLLLRRTLLQGQLGETAQVRSRLNAACERVDERNLDATSFVVPLALDLLEQEFPATLERLRSLARQDASPPSTDSLTSENLQGLDEFRETWELQYEYDVPPEAAA